MKRFSLLAVLILCLLAFIKIGCTDITGNNSAQLEHTIKSVIPAEGPYGAEITIKGRGFGVDSRALQLYFNSSQATLEALEDTLIRAKVPMEAQTGPIEIILNKDTLSGPVFRVDTTRSVFLGILDITPTQGTIGDQINIRGTGFSETPEQNKVLFNDVVAEVKSATHELLKTKVPRNARTGPISVVVGQDTVTGPAFTVNIERSLKVNIRTEGTPASGEGYTLSVENRKDRQVKYNDSQQYDNLKAEKIEVGLMSLPDNCGVEGDNPRQLDLSVNELTTTVFDVACKNIAPVITNVKPTSGTVGTNVIIDGMNFSTKASENKVTFNGTAAKVTEASESTLSTSVPKGATNGPVKVTVDDRTASGPTFTVEAKAPIINSVKPQSGVIDAKVTITGKNFSDNPSRNKIYFNNTSAEVSSASETKLVTHVPEGATSGPVKVQVGKKSGTGPTFTVVTKGKLKVEIATTGKSKDENGYLLSIDNSEGTRTKPNETISRSVIEQGTHRVELSDIASTCKLINNTTNPRKVKIVAGKTTTTSYDVRCKTPNQPPVASFSYNCKNLRCSFNASGSTDPDGNIESYKWKLGDERTAKGSTVKHSYETAGTYRVKLTIMDNESATGSASKKVQVIVPKINSLSPSSGPRGTEVTIDGNGFSSVKANNKVQFTSGNGKIVATIKSASETTLVVNVPSDAISGPVYVTVYDYTVKGPKFSVEVNQGPKAAFSYKCENLSCDFDGSKSTDADGSIKGYSWNFGDENTDKGTRVSYTYETPGTYTAKLIVTDDDGATGSTSKKVQITVPKISGLSPDSGRPGIEVTIDGSGFSADTSRDQVYFTSGSVKVNAPVKAATKTELIVDVPSEATDGPVYVTIYGKTIKSPDFDVITMGTLKVDISTSGDDQDPDGYQLSIDSGNPRPTDVNDTITKTLAAGGHQLRLSDISSNCQLSGTDKRSVEITAGQTSSVAFKISCQQTNQPPMATFTYSCKNLECSFDGSDSSDPDSVIATYNWDYGEYGSGNGATTQHHYEVPGTYTVTLTVKDSQGLANTASKDITVTNPQISGIKPASGLIGTEVTISGSGFSSTNSDNKVTFTSGSGEVEAQIKSASKTTLAVDVPPDATTGPVYVSTYGYKVKGPNFNVNNTGGINVNIMTTGSSQDQNGYDLILDGEATSLVDINDTITFNDLEEGSHTIELADIASNCFISQDRPNPYNVNVTAGETSSTDIDVVCEETNQPPTASFTYHCENLNCEFDGSGSFDPDSVIATYNWDYGEYGSGNGATTQHHYEVPGTYTVTLTVKDSQGLADTASKDITVTNPQISDIKPASGLIGTEVTISGSGFSSTNSDNKVTFTSGSDEVEAQIKSASKTTLAVDVPPDATTGPVYVSTYGYRVSGPSFTVKQRRSLVVKIKTTGDEIDANGYTLSVTGQDDRKVDANGQEKYEDIFADKVQVEVSGIAKNCTLSGNNPRTVEPGTSEAGFTQFDIICQPAELSIDSISPESGYAGDQITITGTGFSSTLSENTVKFYTNFDIKVTAKDIISATPTELVVVVPRGAVSGPLSVGVDGNTVQGPTFNVKSRTLKVITQTTGKDIDPDGYALALKKPRTDGNPEGISFGVNETREFDLYVKREETEVEVILSEIADNCALDGKNRRIINLDTPDNMGSTTFKIMCQAVGVKVSSISPTQGPVGTEIIINGDGFNPDKTGNMVQFTSGSGKINAPVKTASRTELTVDVPSDATTGPVYVTVSNSTVKGPEFTLQANKPPSVFFSYRCKNLDCNFETSDTLDPDGNIVEYKWDFGDGEKGSGATPDHRYQEPGNYTVKLTATDNDGATGTDSKKVSVTVPTVDGLSPDSGAVGTEVAISGSGFSPDDKVQFTSDGGRVDASVKTATEMQLTVDVPSGATSGLIYVTASNYTVKGPTFTVENNMNPVARFTYECQNLECKFDASASGDKDGKVTKYTWQFGDGSKSDGAKTEHNYKNAGNYSVKLLVADNDGATGTRVKDVEVTVPKVKAISPTVGTYNTKVTIMGSGFSEDSTADKVQFTSAGNKVNAPVKTADRNKLTVEVPSKATSGPVYVSVYGIQVKGPTFKIEEPATLKVITKTQGKPDGNYAYTLDVSDRDDRTIKLNDSATYTNLYGGSVNVELKDIADNCSVKENNPRKLNLVPGDGVSTIFNVTCRE